MENNTKQGKQFQDMYDEIELLESKMNQVFTSLQSKVDDFFKHEQDIQTLQKNLMEKNGGIKVNPTDILKLNVGG